MGLLSSPLSLAALISSAEARRMSADCTELELILENMNKSKKQKQNFFPYGQKYVVEMNYKK